MPFTWKRTVKTLLLTAAGAIFLTPLQAQSDDVARAIVVSGQVSVLRGGDQVALFTNAAVHRREVILTEEGYAQFQIADGSTFEVFPHSRVTFRDTFNPMELIEVWLGKIRLQIEHRNGPNPKKVSTPTAVISVRGTIFDVSVESDDGTTVVTVEEGQVGVQHRLLPNPQMRILNQNESLRIFPDQPLAKAGANNPGRALVYDAVKRALTDIALENPSGVGGTRLPGGSAPGASTGQGDKKKGGGSAPTGAPPASPTSGGND